MDWYEYFALSPVENDDVVNGDDDLWSIWTFEEQDFFAMWLAAWGDRYDKLFTPIKRASDFQQSERNQQTNFSLPPVVNEQKKIPKCRVKRTIQRWFRQTVFRLMRT